MILNSEYSTDWSAVAESIADILGRGEVQAESHSITLDTIEVVSN